MTEQGESSSRSVYPTRTHSIVIPVGYCTTAGGKLQDREGLIFPRPAALPDREWRFQTPRRTTWPPGKRGSGEYTPPYSPPPGPGPLPAAAPASERPRR